MSRTDLTALESWLLEIAPDAHVTAVEVDEKEVIDESERCEICMTKPVEIVAWSRSAGYGYALAISVSFETADEGYDSPEQLGEGPLACCLDCRDECLSAMNAHRLAKVRPADFVGLREAV